MKPYTNYWPPSRPHPGGKPTPKKARAKAAKGAKRAEGKKECREGRDD